MIAALPSRAARGEGSVGPRQTRYLTLAAERPKLLNIDCRDITSLHIVPEGMPLVGLID